MQIWNEEKNIAKESEITKVVTFKIGDEEFAFDIFKVKEIIRMSDITKVPKTLPFIEGVINLRGNVVPIIDLRKRFNLPMRAYNRKTRVIVVEGDSGMVGFVVDAVLETRNLINSCIQAAPSILMGGVDSQYINGVGKLEDRLIILLDINKILSFDEKNSLKEKIETV